MSSFRLWFNYILKRNINELVSTIAQLRFIFCEEHTSWSLQSTPHTKHKYGTSSNKLWAYVKMFNQDD